MSKFGFDRNFTQGTAIMGEIDSLNLGPHNYCTFVHLWDLDCTLVLFSVLLSTFPKRAPRMSQIIG
jgi:hypothetical protein